MVNGKKLGEVGFQYLGTPYSVMDCQAFVEKCLKDCGDSTNLGGSNSWYRKCMENGWVGTPEQCKSEFGSIPTGAFLFILEPVSESTPDKFCHDGVGDATHMGIVTNTGEGAIHSSRSKGCVCESKFKGKTISNGGWNRVGLWNRVDYGLNSSDGGGEDPVTMIATVRSKNGGSVKMRANPSTSCSLYWDIPNGSVVRLIDWGDKWSKIKWGDQTGYMMSEFLVRGGTSGVDGTPPTSGVEEFVMVPREDLLRIYNAIGELLGVTVGRR